MARNNAHSQEIGELEWTNTPTFFGNFELDVFFSLLNNNSYKVVEKIEKEEKNCTTQYFSLHPVKEQ